MKKSFLFIFCFFVCIAFYGQSKINKAEKSISKTEKHHGDSNNDSNITETGFFSELFVNIIFHAFYYLLIEVPGEKGYEANNGFITKYPYQNSNAGNYIIQSINDTTLLRSTFSTKYISENRRIKGMHLNLDIRFAKRFDIETDYLQLWEKNQNFGNDNLAIYTVLGKYNRVRSEKFNAWWGLGGSYIDGEVNDFGFTYGLGGELFFAKPLSFELNFNQSFINSENINKFNALINYHINRCKLIGGYENLKIGNQNFSTVGLGLGVFL